MKMLRVDRVEDRSAQPRQHAISHAAARPAATWAQKAPVKHVKAKPRKRRKGLISKLFEEAFDVIEDIFD
jgi:hypothetical protein